MCLFLTALQQTARIILHYSVGRTQTPAAKHTYYFDVSGILASVRMAFLFARKALII